MNKMLTTNNLTKTVKLPEQSLTILSEVSLTVNEHDSVAIVGASGSGKSTLLSLLAGLDTPSEGEVELAGHPIHKLSEDERAAVRAQYVGFVFQSFHLLPGLTALENVMLPIELKEDKNAQIKAKELLEKVGLAERLSHYPHQLSGGEQQRVAIARAFASEPKILFADEPTGNLDTANGEKIIDLIFDLNQQLGTTLVLVTHDDRLAERCQRLVRLEAGKVIEDSVNESFEQAKTAETA
ncbi:ABC transporter [Kangiella profundi]|uniref:ABC transporter n=1 Tax=Kangiella profundi TaxID=1561924 RepID=A0A2K9AT91_9GAMM|nr:ABC transporter ATP-binding protein [Kangiella profundi]AUD78381.1 ABC transporter [Kangiella profundi]GGF07469.1 ABC transporter ATP-binding protein [Kangiella profundi]